MSESWEDTFSHRLKLFLRNACGDKNVASKIMKKKESLKKCFIDSTFDPQNNNQYYSLLGSKVFESCLSSYVYLSKLSESEKNSKNVSNIFNAYREDNFISSIFTQLLLDSLILKSKLVKQNTAEMNARAFKALFGFLSLEKFDGLDNDEIVYSFFKNIYDKVNIETTVHSPLFTRLTEIYRSRGWGKFEVELEEKENGLEFKVKTPENNFLQRKYGSYIVIMTGKVKSDKINVYSRLLEILTEHNLIEFQKKYEIPKQIQELFVEATKKASSLGISNLSLEPIRVGEKKVCFLYGVQNGQETVLAEGEAGEALDAQRNALKNFLKL